MDKKAVVVLLFVACSCLTSNTKSGYIQIKPNQSLFYTLTTQEKTAAEINHRLIFWNNGGPGVSSLMGFFGGIGPLNANEFGTVSPNPYSFSYLGDLVTIDQPYGTGLSNTNAKNDENLNEEIEIEIVDDYEKMAENLSDFFVLFLQENPQYRDYEIVFAGESMAGFFIPKAVLKLKQKLSRMNSEISIFLVSPWIDPITHYSEFVNFAKLNNMIAPNGEPMLLREQKKCIEGLKNEAEITKENVQNCYNFTDLVTNGTNCRRYDVSVKAEAGSQNPPKLKEWQKFEENLRNGKINDFLGLTTKTPIAYQRANSEVATAFMIPSSRSAIDDIKIAVAKNIQIGVVSGKLDLVSNYLSARNWISEIEAFFEIKSDEFQTNIKYVDSFKSSDGFKQYEIAEAGHSISYRQPQALQLVLKDFLVRKENKFKIIADH